MTTWISKTMLAAATLVFAGAASAQTLTAEIPFAFRANGALLSPGAYRFVANSTAAGRTIYQVRNVDTRQTVLAPTYSASDPEKSVAADRKPKIIFRCAGECSLSGLWAADDQPELLFRVKNPKHEEMHVQLITAEPAKAE
jgi:hypothetical protein